MSDLAYPLAVAIVVAVPIAAMATLALLSEWGRWMLRNGGELGWRGLTERRRPVMTPQI